MFASRIASLTGAALLALTVPHTVLAQSAQRFSVQASGLYVRTSGEAFEGLKAGPGVEAQFRFTPSLWSIGIGGQMSSHSLTEEGAEDITDVLAGVFIEPRRVLDIGSSRVAPYLSARLAYLQQSIETDIDVDEDGFAETATTLTASGGQVNAGGGLLLRLTPRLNLDLGATYGLIKFGDATAKVDGYGTFKGLGKVGNGQNVVVRVGLAIGIGG